jgi:hypothetical protein
MRLAIFLPLFALLLSGCAGYQIGPIQPKTMRGVKTLAVGSFKNDTLEPRVEVLLANSVIKQLQQDGTYRITDEHHADAILEGALDTIRRRPQRSVRGNVEQTKEFDLVLRVRYRVIDRVTGRELEARTVNGQTSFFVTGSNTIAADVNQDERQALPIAAEDLAVRMVSQISEGW